MLSLSRDKLKGFQLKAAGELSQMLSTYPAPPYKPLFNQDGELLPFLCRLKAITGSGKTPMLALAAGNLSSAIILWTTNRGAIISQTAANLNQGGRYAELLPPDVRVLELSKLTDSDWSEVVSAQSGLTIILSTVALFNREGDELNVHKPRGDTTYWQMLAGEGSAARKRDLYVFYDEAHGGTKAQFSRLSELHPRAFVLSSASSLPEELSYLLRGNDSEEKSASLELQTVVVPTPEVVKKGLLKTRLYMVDCNTTREDALKEANNKWFDLSQKLKPLAQWPIMCCVVNNTAAGLEVWELLTQRLKVDPRRVAVHLANVSKILDSGNLNPNAPWGQVVDTHKAKKTPEALHDEGYTHLIWNLSLREGWDEPWAYVAYLDGTGKSLTDISQKIGRFLRQPEATPFDDGDLNSAYFYFNIPDEEFANVLAETQRDLENQGYEIISVTGSTRRLTTSRESPLKRNVEIEKVSESFGEDLDVLDQILLENVPLFDAKQLRAPGKVSTRVLDLRRNQEDGSLKKEEHREDNAEIRVWDYLIDRLSARDGRIANKGGHSFSPFIKDDEQMKQKMQFGSPAMEHINRNLTQIILRLNNEFRLEYEPDQKYEVKSFNLVSPDLQNEDPVKREKYKVRSYDNALHAEYNGMNPFEVEIAEALDSLGNEWCRNPSRTGYGIPIPEIGEGSTKFYPDFLLWSSSSLWAIDPKGAHLVNDAIFAKLMGLSDIDGMALKIRVALVMEGEYAVGPSGRPNRLSGSGCSLIQKYRGQVRAKNYANPKALVAVLK